jgi:hypothetical protein
MKTEITYDGRLGLSEHDVRTVLEEELVRAMRAEGAPTIHAIAHAVARAIALDHQRVAADLEAAGVRLVSRGRSERDGG